MNIGKSIKLAAIEKGVKLKDVAIGVGMGQASFSRISNSDGCSQKMLEKLCNYFQMKASDFIALGENDE